MAKLKTNEQRINALLRDLHTLEVVILRERIQKISEITRQAIMTNPTSFDNPIFDHTYYLGVCDKIDKHLNAD